MKHAVSLLFVVPLALACSDVAQDPTGVTPSDRSLAAEAAAPDRATGHWEVEIGLDKAKYSASAVRQADGTVAGQFQVLETSPDSKTRVHGETTCLRALPDGSAIAGGVITSENIEGFDGVGLDALWLVQDNGEGRNDPPDMATDIRYGFPAGTADAICAGAPVPAQLVPFPVERGNIQVRFAELPDDPPVVIG